LTGSHATGQGDVALPFLYQGPLTSAAEGDPVSVLQPPFPGTIKTATFYGPDTNSFNPDTIPAGQIRAVGSYQSSASRRGVLNRGMIYLGPLRGSGGSWTSIDVPADGSNTVGGVRACPQNSPGCFVMDTIAHSTMGDLVVGNYDLNLGHGVSGNAFIYNMSTQQWTLLQLGGSLSSQTTLYGVPCAQPLDRRRLEPHHDQGLLRRRPRRHHPHPSPATRPSGTSSATPSPSPST
jgi:hypothetical protein